MMFWKNFRFGCLILALVLSPATLPAQTNLTAQTGAAKESAFAKLWAVPQLYHNDQNPFIEEFDLTGRLQLDYFYVNSNRGVKDFLEIRRFRFGFDSWFIDRHLEVKATVDTALLSYHAPSIFYNRMTDLYVSYHANDALNIRAGKFEPHFGYDREFSDTQQKFFERSFFDDQIFNKTGNDYVTGASVLGKYKNWGYQVAAFSDDVDKELGQFKGGSSQLFELNYDFSKALAVTKALWAADFMHMENNVNSDVFNTMHNAAATYFDFQKDRFSLVAQAGYGNGTHAKGDLYEFMLMPGYYLIREKLETVFRYQSGTATRPNGIALLNRQDKTLGSFTGDQINSAYLGLNYYIYGQKCKVMLGEQFDDLTGGTGKNAGYQGWTTLAGFRMYW